jgi:hypothetical protein
MRRWILVVIATVVIAGIAGYAIFLTAKPQDAALTSAREPVWTEAAWPFPIDQWGQGWAYQCKAADCGVEVNLYLRPKIGFCNCQTGVADDEELDRVSDTDLVGGERSALTSGRPITVHWMKGRSRGYKVAGSTKPVLSFAFNNKCDVIVATVVAGSEPASQEEAVLAFLNGDLVLHWAEQVVGPPADRWDGRLTGGDQPQPPAQ